MFTGIIQELGTISDIRRVSGGASIKITAPTIASDLKLGDSVAVNGVCLTATVIGRDHFQADIAAETLSVTTLGGLKRSDKVDLEPALRLGDRIGGHMVTGHVDGVGTIKGKVSEGGSYRLIITVPPEVEAYLIKKGSVAVDGISLTVANITGNKLEIAIIPHTDVNTVLSMKKVGDNVNLEADMIGKFVQKFTSAYRDRDGLEINPNNFDLFKESGLL